jgi:hypothetical protein
MHQTASKGFNVTGSAMKMSHAVTLGSPTSGASSEGATSERSEGSGGATWPLKA